MVKNSDTRYVFYFPTKRIGGAQLLFARIAGAVISKGIKVLVIGENDQDFISKFLIEKNLDFEFSVTSKTNRVCLNQNDLLVLSLSDYRDFEENIKLHDNTRVVFWDLHPYALLGTTALSRIYESDSRLVFNLAKILERGMFKNIGKFIETANIHGALYFMCARNFQTHKDLFNFKINPFYLPIPVTLTDQKCIKSDNNVKRRGRTILRIGWIGRMDPSKITILRFLISDILEYNQLNSTSEIHLHAIGDGSAFEDLVLEHSETENFVHLPGVLYGDKLDDYLENNIDIGFSMGTSALEFGKRGIATVLVPSVTRGNFFNKESRRYVWLYDSRGYDLAVERIYDDNRNKDFYSIINEYHISKNCALLSKDYVIRNHSFVRIFNNFLKVASKSSFTYSIYSSHHFSQLNFFQRFLFFLKRLYVQSKIQ